MDIEATIEELKDIYREDYEGLVYRIVDVLSNEIHYKQRTITALENTIATKDERIKVLEDQNRRFSEKIRHLEHMQF